jgi:hypothetical protein
MALEAEFKSRGDDDFVAQVFLFTSTDGESLTLTTWAEGADGLLPETDVVAFVRPQDPGAPRMYTFRQVERALSELMEEASSCGFPIRYRVRGYPTEEQFEAMGQSIAL